MANLNFPLGSQDEWISIQKEARFRDQQIVVF